MRVLKPHIVSLAAGRSRGPLLRLLVLLLVASHCGWPWHGHVHTAPPEAARHAPGSGDAHGRGDTAVPHAAHAHVHTAVRDAAHALVHTAVPDAAHAPEHGGAPWHGDVHAEVPHAAERGDDEPEEPCLACLLAAQHAAAALPAAAAAGLPAPAQREAGSSIPPAPPMQAPPAGVIRTRGPPSPFA